MKVLISDKLDKNAVLLLKEAKIDYTEKFDMSVEELLNEIPSYDSIIVRSATKVTKEVIDAGKNLKVIGRSGVGLDNIDTAYAKEKNIAVVNSPNATSKSVAEQAISLVFAIYKNTIFSDNSMKDMKWEKKKIKNRELSGKTLGIVGGGNIGLEVAKIAKALSMNVIVSEKFKLHDELVKMNVENLELTELLKRADIISLHVPMTPETKNLISKKEFEIMKDDAVLINTARGGIVNENDLLDTLESGKLLGAGLDVFEKEPVPADNKLVKHPKVVATPHVSGNTNEGQARASETTVQRVIEHLKSL